MTNSIIELRQNVFLERHPQINAHGVTWLSTGVVGRVYELDHFKERLKAQVDEFISAYQSVND